jgi:two-component system, NarL family, nitrate/nitrite response regulator NarL
VPALSVVVADDHGLTLSAVSDSLVLNGLTVVARSAGPRQVMDDVVKHQPDALVVDLDLGPGPSGIDIALSLRRRFPDLGIVILSGYADPRLLAPNLPPPPRGAVYLVKQQISGISAIVEAITESVERARTGAAAAVPRVDLTRSQVAVLDLLAQGLSNAAIARRLFITEDAVAKQVSRIAKRLGLRPEPDTNTRAALTQKYFSFIGNRREP